MQILPGCVIQSQIKTSGLILAMINIKKSPFILELK